MLLEVYISGIEYQLYIMCIHSCQVLLIFVQSYAILAYTYCHFEKDYRFLQVESAQHYTWRRM